MTDKEPPPMTRLLRRAVLVTASLAISLTLAAGTASASPIIAVGDISPPPTDAANVNDHAVAALIRQHNPSDLLLVGDIQYQVGRYEEYTDPFGYLEPGGFGDADLVAKSIPISGNHDAMVTNRPYLDGLRRFFGERGRPGVGSSYWSFDRDAIHYVILDSNCGSWANSPSCAGGSAQVNWLKADLAASNARCVIALFHHPYRSSSAPFDGTFNEAHTSASLWSKMVVGGVTAVINGHNHAEEILKPMRTQGNVDQDSGPGDGDDGLAGIRTFIAGGGGSFLLPYTAVHPQSTYRANKYGFLKLVPNSTRTGFATGFKYTDGTTSRTTAYGCVHRHGL